MIVSAIAAPDVFGPQGIIDEATRSAAIQFLEGIVENGVLLDTPDREFLLNAIAEAQRLATTKQQQRVLLFLQEINKLHKKFVQCCDKQYWPQHTSESTLEKCRAVSKQLKPDVIVLSTLMDAQFSAPNDTVIETTTLSRITETHYEEKRRRMRELDRPLDETAPEENRESFGRLLKYAHVLRIFDYRMVGSVSRASKYLEGIKFIVTIWEKWSVVPVPKSRILELYTVGETHVQGAKGGFLTGAEASERLEKLIVKPLTTSTSAQIRAFVKKDSEPPIFHARGIEAKKRAYTIDPGFDALDTNGPIRGCLLTRSKANEGYFARVLKLKDVP